MSVHRYLNFFKLILFAALVAACTSQKSETLAPSKGGGNGIFIGGHGGGDGGNGGGIDPGGGKFTHASKEEVQSIVDSVWMTLTWSDTKNPILIAYRKLLRREERSSEQQHILEMLNKILWGDETPPLVSPDKLVFPKTRLDALKNKEVEYAWEGRCQGVVEDDTLMAVSSFDFDGHVCVNVQAMMRSSTSSSYLDVMALMVHEIAHLAGYRHNPKDENQDDLKRIQRFFSKHAALLLGLDRFMARGAYAVEVSSYSRIWYRSTLAYDQMIDQKYIAIMNATKAYFERLAYRAPEGPNPMKCFSSMNKVAMVASAIRVFIQRWQGCEVDDLKRRFNKANCTNLKEEARPWNEDLLKDLRKILLAELTAESTVNECFFGSDLPTRSGIRSYAEIDSDRNMVIEMTEPSRLNRDSSDIPPEVKERIKNSKNDVILIFSDKEALPKDSN